MRRGGAGGLAVLPMYDLPELRAETDALWAALREAIRDHGLDAPEALTREGRLRRLWAAPELVLGQTCGLPYARVLRGRVGLVGTPAYALEGCGPGEYVSLLVTPVEGRIASTAELRGARPAINARDSQSGYAALMDAAAALADGGRVFAEPVITGSHAASLDAVAERRADVAAIDAVSWALGLSRAPAADRVRVIGRTRPAPGLPLITGRRRDAARLALAVEAGLAALDPACREALLLTGFVQTRPETYDVIRDRLAAAEARHRLPGPGGG